MSSDERNEPGEAPLPDAWPLPEWTSDGHVAEPTVHAWLDGALAPDGADAVAAHVAQCAACGVLVAEVRGVIAGAARVVALLDGAEGAPLRAEGGGGGATRLPPRAWYRHPAVLSLAATLLLAVGVRTVWQEGARPAEVGAMVERLTAAEVMADSAAVAAPEAVVAAKADAAKTGAEPMARRAPMAAAPPSAPLPAPAPAPPPPPAPVARAMVAERVAAMAPAADAVGASCLLVEAPQAAGITLPPRMRLVVGGENGALLQWLWDGAQAPPPLEFRLRSPSPDSLAGTDTRALGIRVTLAREGDEWRGTATAAGDGAAATRAFRLRPTEGGRCEGERP